MLFRSQENIKPDNIDQKLKNDNDQVQGTIEEVLVSKTNSAESEIHAIVNPNIPSNILISPIRFQSFGYSTPIFYSKDNGKTWTKSSLTTGKNSIGGGDPIFTADADGNIYYSWIELSFPQSGYNIPNAIFVSKSTNGGVDWSSPDSVFSGMLSYQTDRKSVV